MPSAEEDVGVLDPSLIAGQNTKRYSHFEKQLSSFFCS